MSVLIDLEYGGDDIFDHRYPEGFGNLSHSCEGSNKLHWLKEHHPFERPDFVKEVEFSSFSFIKLLIRREASLDFLLKLRDLPTEPSYASFCTTFCNLIDWIKRIGARMRANMCELLGLMGRYLLSQSV